MTVTKEEIIEFLKELAADEDIKVTLQECVKAGLIIGGMAALASLFGPIPVGICGSFAACHTAAKCKDFKSLVEIIAAMDESKQKALAERVMQIMKKLDVYDIKNFTILVSDDSSVKNEVTAELINYINTK